MSIELKQYDGANVTPKDDAILYDMLFADSGIIDGCDLVYLGGSQIRICDGRGIVKGRNFVIEEEIVHVNLSNSGNKNGRLLIRINMQNPNTPIAITSQVGGILPDLVQNERCNYEGGIYEIELASYVVSEIAVVDFRQTFKMICSEATKADIDAILNNEWKENENYEDIDGTYFAATNAEVMDILGNIF